MSKQLSPFEIRQSDRSTAIKLNERTPCYLSFCRLSSPSDVNSPIYFAINCKIWYELKVLPFVAGERYRAVLLIVRRPYIWERTIQISAESNRRVPSKTAIMVATSRHQNMRKQLTPFEIRQSDRSTAIKLNERTPCYLSFGRFSSPSDVNSPSYFAINCKNLVQTQGAAVCRR